MMSVNIIVTCPRPYFAELPYYLWGEINYDSDGDCKNPTDQNWTELYLENRVTDETITITGEGSSFKISSNDTDLIMKTELFFISRLNLNRTINPDIGHEWSHSDAMNRTFKVKSVFDSSVLKPFDNMSFFGSWKWIGRFGTDFTCEGRWIMDGVLNKDSRVVSICADWLKAGTNNKVQSKALCYALNYLTGMDFSTESEWIDWYYKNGLKKFPKFDYNEWIRS